MTGTEQRTKRLVGAALAAFLALELATEVRALLRRSRRASTDWVHAIERRDERRQREAALVVLLSRLAGARSKRG